MQTRTKFPVSPRNNYFDFLDFTQLQDCNTITPLSLVFRVSVGDFIWGHREEPEDTWVRGCVVSTGPPHKIAIIDEGKMAVVTEICPIAKEDMGLVAFGVQLNIPNSGKVIDDCIAVNIFYISITVFFF